MTANLTHANFMTEIFRHGSGWRPWMYSPPGDQTAVEAWRYGWEFPETFVISCIGPDFNVAGLYWREIP